MLRKGSGSVRHRLTSKQLDDIPTWTHESLKAPIGSKFYYELIVPGSYGKLRYLGAWIAVITERGPRMDEFEIIHYDFY